MPARIYHQSLNVGVVDANKLHRVDLERMRLAAEIQTNLLCDAVGRAFLRPGLQMMGHSRNGAECRLINFVAGSDAAYVLELTDYRLRIFDGDSPLERPSVSSTITNGDFGSPTGWTLSGNTGDLSLIGGGKLEVNRYAKGAASYVRQQVNTSSPGVEHAVRIVVERGPVLFRIGSAANGFDLVTETILRTGTHSIAFKPLGSSYWVQFNPADYGRKIVDSITVESAGVVELPTKWPLAALQLVQPTQSLDVMYLGCEDIKQQRIERHGYVSASTAYNRSWSVVDYESDDGPFMSETFSNVRLTPSAVGYEITVNASEGFFTPAHVGSLFKLNHDTRQTVVGNLAGLGEYTDPIMVSGVNESSYNERDFTVTIAGTWAGTLRTQRSFEGADVEYHDYRRETATPTVDITANATFINDDNEDNATTWYRLGFYAYTSGTAQIIITYDGSGGSGIFRVTEYVTPTQVSAVVLDALASTFPTSAWQESRWSAVRGYPAAPVFHEGRLGWVGADTIELSVSDAYDSFDEDYIGNAGPIIRSIALGGRNQAYWAISMGTLLIGTDGRIAEASASSLGELMTPESFKVTGIGSSVGASPITPVLMSDDKAMFVEKSGTALYELAYDATKGRSGASEFSKLTTDIYTTGIRQLAVQNVPDQRIWVTINDAAAACIVYEPALKVAATVTIETSDGDIIESVCTVPSPTGQDRLWVSVKRTVNGQTLRYIERMALDREALPNDITKTYDSFVTFGPGTNSVSLPHLIGRTVTGWVDGAPLDDEYVVPEDGLVTLPETAVIGGAMGLVYLGRYKSARLAYGADGGTTMLKKHVLSGAGLMLADYCRSGIRLGFEFDNPLRPLRSLPTNNTKGTAPEIVRGLPSDEPVVPIGGEISFDSRLCIEITKPATILALVMEVEPKT